MKIKINKLKELTKEAVLKYGYTDREAEIIQNILLYAQLRGNNQGVVKLIGKGIPKRDKVGTPKIVKETPVSALYDGNETHAMVVMDLITDTAIDKAKKSGIGIVGNFNTSESSGALGYYVSKVVKEGLIGIAYASAPFQTTAPYGSTEALFCTNPVAYGIPTDSDPIILDMTTSAIAYYGLIEAKTANKTVAEGTGYDKDGNPSQNPAEIMSGALKTFGGHRGSGLALIGQIFAGALVQADSFNSDSDNAGNLVMAINPEILTSKESFIKEVSSIIKRIKSAKKADGVSEILIPGERGNTFNSDALTSSEIEIEDNLYSELEKVVNK
ncbi:MAG TPA: Ldh family oxidoreductase [Candidatus Saccharimonadales bacterium]|nr:Ldh family oxidoreductase [Candidatus Saccharimonadales bacterium]